MNFTSAGFLLFLPAVLLVHRLLPRHLRWAWLLAASYFFYGAIQPGLLLLIFATTAISFLCAKRIGAGAHPKRYLVLCCVCSLGTLFLFKYLSFFLSGLDWLASLRGGHVPVFSLILPVGISFYTFQTLSYVIDVYRGQIAPESHLGYYALYVVFFPQLVAGPIERPGDLLPQLHDAKTADARDASQGLALLLRGYGKKLLIADVLAPYVNTAFAAEHAGGAAMAAATVLFSVQIYCDFSGYCDIAAGCARFLGIRLTENFRHPYQAATLREFWQRWHITLNRWFRDYLYIPLGGSRGSPLRRCGNLLVVFLASGLWHGARLTFVLWGAIHGIFRIAELFRKPSGKVGKFLHRIATLAVVEFAWIFFRSETPEQAFSIVRRIFTDLRPQTCLADLGLTASGCLLLGLLMLLLPLLDALQLKKRRSELVCTILCLAILTARIMMLLRGGPTAFLYFQF